MNQKKKTTHQEPIESIKVWIVLGYPSNILGCISNYCNYTSKKKLGFIQPSPKVDNFFNIRHTKTMIEHKRCRI